jgi:hypothetical protein
LVDAGGAGKYWEFTGVGNAGSFCTFFSIGGIFDATPGDTSLIGRTL